MIRLKKVALLICALIFLYGCAEVLLVGIGAGVGVASYMYVDGSLAIEYPVEYDRGWDATNRALEQFKIRITNRVNENGSGKIEAVREDGKPVIAKLKKKDQGITIIAVRVGAFGDRAESQKIHNEIVSIAGI